MPEMSNMLEDINKDAIVGSKQVLRAMQAGSLKKIYIAENVEAFLMGKLKEAAYANGVPVEMVTSMLTLGEACNIDVGAACVGIIK